MTEVLVKTGVVEKDFSATEKQRDVTGLRMQECRIGAHVCGPQQEKISPSTFHDAPCIGSETEHPAWRIRHHPEQLFRCE